MSEIEGIVADDPNKIRGDRVERLIYEECFGKDTLVIMSDYSRKPIQDIKVGDFVMGIDGTPQEVIHTCSGLDDLYWVRQRKGEDYVVNSKHKIYTEFRPRIGNKPDVIELLTPLDYFSLSKYYKQTHYGLKSSGLQFNNQIDGIDFYYFGLWLGDGFSSGSKIVINETDDPEIKSFVLNYYNSIIKDYPNHQIKISANSINKTNKILNNYSLTTINHQGSIIYNWLKEHNEINNKHIFKELLYLPITERLKILAGIIDTDGNLKKGSTSYSFSYEIAMSRKQLILDIQELAKSCGFDTSYNERIISQGYKKDSISYRVIIRGELRKIPVRIKRKQLPKDYVVTTNALSTSIKIEPFGYGEYYGFTLKTYNKPTDNLFLLNDYTIVHNCGSQPKLIKAWIQGNALVEIGGEKIGIRLAGGRFSAS